MIRSKMNLNKLINCVYVRPALWDQQHDGHNNKMLCKQMWENISKEMNLSVEMCRQKWKSLRDVHRRELRKYNSRLTDPIEEDKSLPKWHYFKDLQFLQNQNYLDGSKIDENTEIFESFYVKCESNDNDEDCVISARSSETEESKNEEIYEVCMENSGINRVSGMKTLKRRIEDSAQDTKVKLKPGNSRYEEEDSDYHFVMSILPFFRELPKNRKLVLRTKIMSLFCDEANLS